MKVVNSQGFTRESKSPKKKRQSIKKSLKVKFPSKLKKIGKTTSIIWYLSNANCLIMWKMLVVNCWNISNEINKSEQFFNSLGDSKYNTLRIYNLGRPKYIPP